MLDATWGIPIGETSHTEEESDQERDECANQASQTVTRQRLAAIVESSDDAIISKTLDGIITTWNASAERMYGHAAAEAIGQSVSILIPPEWPDEMPQILDSIRRGERIDHYETVRVRKNGEQIHVSLTVSPIRDREGNITGASAIARDITEQIRNQEQVKLQQQQLIQADKMASLGVLVSGMTHEINNPNNFIALNAQLLAKAWSDAMPILQRHYEQTGDYLLAGVSYTRFRERIGQLTSGILNGSERIQAIVESLRDFVHHDVGDLDQQVDLNTVVESAVLIVRGLVEKSTHCFTTEYGTDLPTIRGNSQQLEQVIINLLTNACQALQHQGACLTISTAYDREDARVLICVCDDGMGIAPEDLGRIIEPFFTTKQDRGGTGLGLSVSYNIVKAHGGEMHFVSDLGKGTTVNVTLPIQH